MKTIDIRNKKNVCYIHLRKGKMYESIKLGKNTVIDLDKKGEVLGIEMLERLR